MKDSLTMAVALVMAMLTGFLGGRYILPGPAATAEPVVVTVRDTVVDVQYKDVYVKGPTTEKIVQIPDTLSFKWATSMTRQRDSLRDELRKLQVEEISVLDTVLAETRDTINVKHYELSNWWELSIKLAPRKTTTIIETVYLPPPKREWYDNPIVGGVAGFIIGSGAGILTGIAITK